MKSYYLFYHLIEKKNVSTDIIIVHIFQQNTCQIKQNNPDSKKKKINK